jgi:hypothetical protein
MRWGHDRAAAAVELVGKRAAGEVLQDQRAAFLCTHAVTII